MALIITKIISYLAILTICFLVFKIVISLQGKTNILENKAKYIIDSSLKKRGVFASKKKKLSQMGIMYRFHNYDLDPSYYYIIKIFVVVFVSLSIYGFTYNLRLCPIGLLAWVLPDFLFMRLNQKDNDDMMIDIYNTYANMKLQLSSGIYIANAIESTYDTCQNERYRQALGELIINFSNKSLSLSEAVEIFKNRFNSKEIDKLCAMINDFFSYGASEAYMNDIMGEIQTIILATTIKAEHDIEERAGFHNFSFFGLIIIIVAYAVMKEFSGIELFW